MIKIDRILCPTDLSTESDEALRYAVALTCAYEAKLVLLHCRKNKFADAEGELTDDRMTGLFGTSLAPHLGLANLCDLDWTGVVATNVEDVGKAIVAEAQKQESDLIVMRSRRLGRKAVLLGSTAETVSEHAPCPVLVTHPQEREWVGLTTGEIDLRRILVACDFSSDSELALKFAFSLAQEYQAEVHLLHVLSNAGREEPEGAWSTSGSVSEYELVARKLQQMIPKEVFLWCNVVSVVRAGKAHDELLNYAREKEIDLICIGASGDPSAVSQVLGSNVDRVLREAPCPVLVARPLNASGEADATQKVSFAASG